MCIHMCICTCAHMCACAHVFVHSCVQTCINKSVHACVCMYVGMHAYMCGCMCTCVCVYPVRCFLLPHALQFFFRPFASSFRLVCFPPHCLLRRRLVLEMYVCMSTSLCACVFCARVCTCTRTYVLMRVFLRSYACICVCRYGWMHVCVRVSEYEYTSKCTDVCRLVCFPHRRRLVVAMCVYACVHTCARVSVCLCAHVLIHACT